MLVTTSKTLTGLAVDYTVEWRDFRASLSAFQP